MRICLLIMELKSKVLVGGTISPILSGKISSVIGRGFRPTDSVDLMLVFYCLLFVFYIGVLQMNGNVFGANIVGMNLIIVMPLHAKFVLSRASFLTISWVFPLIGLSVFFFHGFWPSPPMFLCISFFFLLIKLKGEYSFSF